MVNANDTHDVPPLTRLEVLVLARLSAAESNPPSERELAKTVHDLALPEESPSRAREVALETLEALRGRGLVNRPARPRKGTLGKRSLTDEGRRVLRAMLGLARVPTWSQVRDAHLSALAFGQKPGSEQAKAMAGSADAIAATVLRGKLEIEDAPTVSDVYDVLLAEALGMPPGKITLSKIRAHVLARRLGIESKGEPADLVARAVAMELGIRGEVNKNACDRALGRRWLREGADAKALPVAHERPAAPEPAAPPKVSVAPAPDASAALLQIVREAIPRIGEEGRFGDEKVFVSALWHNMERDRRLGDLSLDRFKRWLVRANRDGWLILVRADLVGAMDAKLVADSEIEDRGATFHFVLDPRWAAAASERRTHVR
jgi:hypothetical protein